MTKRQIIDVAHVSSKGSSYRITLPKKIIQRLNLSPDDIIAFLDDDGIKIDKLI
ncbi:MAG: AbrB/MazE/SpoVT family DNA-binding domain-containing protein [Thermoplasmataceae archaeon]|jgi:bifunctional DNA-binding transcriptional regulator/antitoxin component of YhaV-PrlF toxin-antitoxin module